ncbi:MAG: PspA/IM30 family protein [Pseudomonadota bacterium]
MSTLFKRINMVINASVNDVIDKVEDPERMIKQMIREMEENIALAKEGVIDAIASEKRLERELEKQREQSKNWNAKAELALKNSNEELARSALARKKESDGILNNLESSWQSAANTSERLKTQLRALEEKLKETQHKRSMLVARQRASEARQHMHGTLDRLDAGLDAHAEFSRMEDKVAEMEARTEAWEALNNPTDPLEETFEALENDTDINEELAALKRKMELA